jgi:hypothetical protein
MPQPLTIVLVDKTGELKSLTVKDYKEDELFKKCGFKKNDGFAKQAEWPVKFNGQKYSIMMYGKDDGKANMENKYDFPPPVDKKLLFGCCVLVGQIRDDNNKKTLINLSVELWTKLYEKLFGGFEDLTTNNDLNVDDDDEEDELDSVPKSKKTKIGGYMKDGFVVDDESDSDDSDPDDSDESNESGDDDSDDNKGNSKVNKCNNNDVNDDGLLLEDIGSELSEDSYDYE